MKKPAIKPINLGHILAEEQHHLPLWIPVIFALGVIFYFCFGANSILAPALLLVCSIFLSIKLKYEFKSLIAIAIALFLSGFLWSKFYDEKFIAAPVITSDIYGTAIGKVEMIKEYEDGGKKLTISDLNIYEYRSASKTAKPKFKKRKNNELSEKPKKITKTILKTYLNIEGFTEIDRELNKSDDANHFKERKYQNPPRKIDVTVRASAQQNGCNDLDLAQNKFCASNVEIGDVIKINVLLQPFPPKDQLDNFNFTQFNYFKQIGGSGFAIGNLYIIEKNLSYDFVDQINNFRYKIAKNIQDNFKENKQEAAVFIALLLGIMDFIDKDLMENVRKSGLAHLLSISGMHLSLAAAIFFITFRFLLTRSQYFALRFNVKKIVAVLAIISSFGYLLLAGAPIPAIRSFFMILVIFLAILFDQNSNPLRSLAFAALAIFIINPAAIFSISFQMSFMAILSLVAIYELAKKFLHNDSHNIFKKFIYYFLGITFSSIIAQIALAPLVIYYFNNYQVLGILSNLIAIPLTSFIVMPLAFVYLFLMIFNLEFLTIYPLNFALTNIIKTANFVAELPYSTILVPFISTSSLALIICGFLWICLWQMKWRFLGIIPVILGIYLAYKTPLPNFIIDGKMQYFAIFDEKKGLFFSKNMKKSAKINNLMKKLAVEEFKTIEDLEDEDIFCEYEYCKVKFKGKNLFILTKRTEIEFICSEKYDILVNLSKFQLPNCVDNSKTIINNKELIKNGNQYLYFE